MADGEARVGKDGLFAAVAAARARLTRVAARREVKAKVAWVITAGAVLAMVRPLVWRIGFTAPLWVGFTRAVGLFAVGASAMAVGLAIVGRRRGPSDLAAARAIDEGLGLSEVVASGFAFDRDGRGEGMEGVARQRAVEAVKGLSVSTLFPLPSWRPSRRTASRGAAVALAAVGIGSYDPALVTALVAPPTVNEREASADLEEIARELAAVPNAEPSDRRSPSPRRDRGGDRKGRSTEERLARKAREAAQAARRGDRRATLEKLEDLRQDGKTLASGASELRDFLKRMTEALDPRKGGEEAGKGTRGGAAEGASDSIQLLAKKLRSPDAGDTRDPKDGKNDNERMLDRLDRAGEEARRAAAGGRSADASEAARALSRAAEALRRGDREAAAGELEKAAAHALAMETERAMAAAQAMAVAELLERAGVLERAIQLAMMGREGKGDKEAFAMGEGRDSDKGYGKPGDKDGKTGAAMRAALLDRLAALSSHGDPSGKPGTGPEPHVPDRQRSHHDGLVAGNSTRARSEVTEGTRAIQAINGLGRGEPPPSSYREVFPSYGAAAEEGIADERIPAPRRAAVRRYFEAIRPERP